jgi:F-type H+-transporting ATPase subunit a
MLVKNLVFKVIAIIAIILVVNPTFASDEKGGKYDPIAPVMHHIANSNEFHIWGDIHMPLPCILYSPDNGLSFFMSSKFEHGHNAVDGYVMHHGRVWRMENGPEGTVHLDHEEAAHDEAHAGDEAHDAHAEGESHEGEEAEAHDEEHAPVVHVDGKAYNLIPHYTLNEPTSWFDFSITKNVFGMLLASIALLLIFVTVGRRAKKNSGKAPTGIQNAMEPFFTFIRDEVAIPMIGEKHYERFLPFIMTLFFFILFCNIVGLIPIFPFSANITGNIAVTLTLAVITFLVTTFNGNKQYWSHVLWMPGVPAPLKILILTPVEVLGLIIKPFSLMIRLFANITAGHIIILSLVGLIFLFGQNGTNAVGAGTGALIAIPFTLFMNLIELVVAFIQAFVFAMLSASYIGAAVEEGHEAH